MIAYSLIFACNVSGCGEQLVTLCSEDEVERAYVILYRSGWSAVAGARGGRIYHYCPDHYKVGERVS